MTAAAQGISPFIPSVVAERRGRSTRESSPASITLNLSLVLLLAAASACSGSGDGDAGFQLPPDNCNSEDEAISDPQCALTLGEERVGYIHPPASPGVPDLDYYRVQLPAALSPRTLLHVTAGFSAPSTPVNLSVNVLKQKGTSLAKKVDLHGQGAPKIVDIVIPVTEPGASLTLILRDETPGVATPPYDAKNGYTLKVEVLENPDGNEPNDTAPTQIALTPQGDGQVGQELGYLATDNDVDLFEVSVPPGDQVLWMRISAPKQTPQANYRLRYTLLKDNGTTNPVPISEGWVANEFLPVDLGTARLASAGKYFIRIDGYRPANSNQPIPGDVRLQYTLD
ncbi:MAG TPA: hypothetical protein VEY30_03670, partial [Myxococcaceae bacterium]|nr:hypothetical protein [Myxococcaceae bacterium]